MLYVHITINYACKYFILQQQKMQIVFFDFM